MDETWIHHFPLQSNQQSAEWTAPGESHPKRPDANISRQGFGLCIFGMRLVFLFINYLEKGRTINSKYYVAILVCFEGRNRQKTATNEEEKVFFHQDNAPFHKLITTMATQHELHFELLPHSPYSPDLAPSTYWLFADLKRMLQGKRFGSNEEVVSETEASFEAKDKSFYKKASNYLRSVEISVSPKKETMLINKIRFCLKVVLLVRPRTYWVMC